MNPIGQIPDNLGLLVGAAGVTVTEQNILADREREDMRRLVKCMPSRTLPRH